MPRPRKDTTPLTTINEVRLESKHSTQTSTKERIIEVAKKISQGWTKFQVEEWIKTEWGLRDTSANRYWNAGLALLCHDADDKEFVDAMRRKTIAILNKAIQSEIEERRYKEMNSSLELLSKLLGYNVAKSEVKVEGEVHFAFGELPGEEEDSL